MKKKFGTLVCVMLAICLWVSPAGQTVPLDGPPSLPGAAGPMPVGGESWEHKVVVVPVHGVIIGSPISDMPDQVKAALDRADREKAQLVVLEIDSPGGEVGVCDTLSRRIFESKTPVVALVVHKAVSGGAMLASAAREIVMTRSARMGDIQPMQASLTGSGGQMDDRTAEKIEVDIRTIMKVYAEGTGRPSAVLAAMVSRDMALYKVTFDNGKVGYLDGHELKLYEENIEKGRESVGIAAAGIVKAEGKLLELTAQQAVEFGVASEIVDSAEDFFAKRGIGEEDMVRAEVVEGSFDLKKLIPSLDDIGLPVWVMVLLGVFLIVGVAGIVTEFQAPGTGIPAAIGIIGFVCFFTTLLLHDRGSPIGIVLFLIGIGLLVVEIMVLPGFGVTGIAGILCILGGLFLAFTPDWSSEYMRAFMWHEVGSFTILLFVGMVAALLAIWLVNEYGPRIPLIGGIFLTRSLEAGKNPYPEAVAPEPSESARLWATSLTGRAGMAATTLRPSGKVKLDGGELVDAITDGVFVEAGQRVRVVEAQPGRVLVEVVEQDIV